MDPLAFGPQVFGLHPRHLSPHVHLAPRHLAPAPDIYPHILIWPLCTFGPQTFGTNAFDPLISSNPPLGIRL